MDFTAIKSNLMLVIMKSKSNHISDEKAELIEFFKGKSATFTDYFLHFKIGRTVKPAQHAVLIFLANVAAKLSVPYIKLDKDYISIYLIAQNFKVDI